MSDKSDYRIEHIGWRLWNAAGLWKSRFAEAMIAAGHDWYAEARSSVIPYIGPKGTRQSVLVRRMGLTKQAVQQLVDDLEREGIVQRVPDPKDGRARIIRFTEKGQQAQRDAQAVKRRIEDQFRRELGDADFDHLYRLLCKLAPDQDADQDADRDQGS